MSGVPTNDTSNIKIYDDVEYLAARVFKSTHSDDFTSAIKIRVRQPSYLKYFAMCINRTATLNFSIEDLGIDIFEKAKHHPTLKYFIESLSKISGQTNGNVEPKYVREWLRLCFFANHGTTIEQLVSLKLRDNDYIIDFESFYDGSILRHCCQIYKNLNLTISNIEVVTQLIEQFPKKLVYGSIDLNINQILGAIDSNTNFDLSSTNLLQQAWIDNYLVDNYNIDPYLKNDYFHSTQELRKAYNLS